MAINMMYPWYLLLLIPAIILIILYHGKRRYPQELRPWVMALRTIIFILVILALARPQLVKTYQGLSVVYLLDSSLSVENAADYTDWINESLTYQGVDDQSAVLVFGGDSQLIKPLTMERMPGMSSADIDREHTNIEAAMRVATGLIPGDRNGRIVLISDGLETSGDSLSFAKALMASRLAVDVLPLAVDSGDEVALLDIALPRNTYPGQQVTVEVEVQSTVNTAGELSLTWGGNLAYKEEVALTEGRQRFTLPVEVTGQSLVKVQAQIEPKRDTLTRNNAMVGLTFVDAPPRVLIVEGAPGKGVALTDLFVHGGVEAHRVTPAQLPASPSALAGYRAVFLVDVPAYVLSTEQQQNLELFVRLTGGGVVAVGGKNSFGMGLYQDTPLEKLLPVSMEVDSEEELPGLDLVLVIDRSGSMHGEKLNMAKNAAIVSLDILKERDRISVITFDDKYYVDLPLTQVDDKDQLAGVIENITIGGGTIIYPALEQAVHSLSDGERSKHIVLLSDGNEGVQYDYHPLLAEMLDQGITLSTIAMGSDADANHMQFLAEQVDGRFYLVPNSEDLPGVFLQETVLAGGDYLVEEEFVPSLVHPEMRPLNTATPLFTGYVASTAKPLAEVLMLTHRDHPLLARWQYGLGRAVAFSSDTWGMWSEALLVHPGFADIWTDTLHWVAPRWGDGNIALDIRLQGQGAEITALIGEPLAEGEKLIVTVADEEYEQQELELKPVGGGRYRATVPEVRQGIYLVNASRQGEAVLDQVVSGFAVPYPAEFRIPSSEAGADLLQAVSTDTAGRILSHTNEVFRRPPEPVRRFVEIDTWLLLVAVLLWPLDIAVRRFGAIPTLPFNRRKTVSHPIETSAIDDTMERLLSAKKRKGK